MPRNPSVSGIYGPVKFGKTSDLLAAFHERAIYIAAPGALSPSEESWGFPQPKAYDLETFTEIGKFIEGNDVNGALAIVIDDATLIADRTLNHYKEKGIGGWDLYGKLNGSATQMRDRMRRRELHVGMSCHPQPAGVRDGVRYPGGPAFPGKVAQKLPAAFDLLLRAEAKPGVVTAASGGDLGIGTGPSASSSIGWPFCYRTAYHPDWLQGSRYGTPDMSPMNLGEILRLAGFQIPRMRGLEWQENVANALAQKLIEGPGLGNGEYVKACLLRVKEYCLARITKTEAHVYWALRDGYDRAILHVAAAGQRRQLWGV